MISSCEKNESQVNLNINDSLYFSGTFETINSENLLGTVILNISNGTYQCLTNLPYGRGAGKLDISKTTINFIDTLFFPIPTIYGPSYVLSGEHYYEFDGENLKVGKEKNVGSIKYDLKMTKETANMCENLEAGTLKNLTGFDGCGWVIQLSDSTKLEPINLEDFDIEFEENKSVCIQYHERTDLRSYCMVGKVVEIDLIE